MLLVILIGAIGTAYGADQETVRIRIGLKLFRAILAADTQINSKQDPIVHFEDLLVARTLQGLDNQIIN